ncbi:MAG: hypothetical protein RIS34_1586 [Pseudomonadota bacterium]
MPKSAITLALNLGLCVGLVGGCATSVTPNYDLKFGDALREAKLQMIIDPDAGKNPDMALGIDGGAARETIVRYQNSFKAPPPATNVINIGGSIGGAGQN